eukprot:TRINITY_DN21764_c0_g1_i1.p1 TRINITY_DN21764_c0_g1~~TRINITY_DN21764_c0_g1_i1.p1  ORF type:complete len:541 (+),score=91.52 TRINITY_DN21764_c0_g1_i1:74-1696(+)
MVPAKERRSLSFALAGVRSHVISIASVLITMVSAAPTLDRSGLEPVAKGRLLHEINEATTQAEGKEVLAPFMGHLRSVPKEVIERVISRQWWELSAELVAKSQQQGIDLSFSVRQAVRALKLEVDELVRMLNPKYGLAQQVSPAFQWAQNETCILLTVKYTVRWNAPGALEVTDAFVNMTGNFFQFSGLGKHSNNKYKYLLSLDLFDNIDPAASTWSAASVGKVSVTLRKRWPRMWPRLLANKKVKIGNMHVWFEMQEQQNAVASPPKLHTASQSPPACAESKKLYCPTTDSCKKVEDGCSKCPNKQMMNDLANMCVGVPSEKTTFSFTDADVDLGEIGGLVNITKPAQDFDIDSYALYFGKDIGTRVTDSLLGEVAGVPGAASTIKIPHNTKIVEGAKYLLVFSRNAHGETTTPSYHEFVDGTLPKIRPGELDFVDDDEDKGEIGGALLFKEVAQETVNGKYALYWGKSPTRKIASGAHIADIDMKGKNAVTYSVPLNKKIPDAATHLLAFTKNPFGEFHEAASIKIEDKVGKDKKAEL